MKELIDSRNKSLWDKINSNFKVEVVEGVDGYNCYGEENLIRLTIESNNPSPASFTHELLHAYLRYNECFIGAALKNFVRNDDFLCSILSLDLLEHLSNSLEHAKFLPMFLNLGFKREEFISDYHIRKCTNEQLAMISKSYIIQGKINKEAVDPYIGILSAMIADPNPEFDYSKEYNIFQNLDSTLYESIIYLFSDWKEIDVESNNFLDDNYRDVVHMFGDRIINWYETCHFI